MLTIYHKGFDLSNLFAFIFRKKWLISLAFLGLMKINWKRLQFCAGKFKGLGSAGLGLLGSA